MIRLLTTTPETYNDNNGYNNKYIKIGDEKLWKVYVKK